MVATRSASKEFPRDGEEMRLAVPTSRQASLNAWLADAVSGCAPLDLDAPPGPFELAPPPSASEPFDLDPSERHGLAAAPAAVDPHESFLEITKHVVHRIDEDERDPGQSVNVVSKDKWFHLECALRTPAGLPDTRQIWLHASVVYESGLAVQRRDANEVLLVGQTDVLLFNGKAEFKLKMGSQVLTELHQKRHFRIRVEPSDELIREQCPSFSTVSEPMKSLTKLFRRRPGESACGAAAAPSAASVAGADECRWLRDKVVELGRDREQFRAQLNSHGETLASLAKQQEAIRREIAALHSMAGPQLTPISTSANGCALSSPAKRQRVDTRVVTEAD